jgi:hypothetical protein
VASAWERHLGRWVAAALIDGETAARIRAFEAERERGGGLSWLCCWWVGSISAARLQRNLVRDGKLAGAVPAANGGSLFFNERAAEWVIAEPLAFFIPEHAKDPTRLETGERLWVELSVPPNGGPRPLRLGVKRNGTLTPLELR